MADFDDAVNAFADTLELPEAFVWQDRTDEFDSLYVGYVNPREILYEIRLNWLGTKWIAKRKHVSFWLNPWPWAKFNSLAEALTWCENDYKRKLSHDRVWNNKR